MRYRRIPNWLTATGVLVGLAINAFLYQGWPGLKFGAPRMGLGSGMYFGLYVVRAMGAGDVKLMAAMGAMVGWPTGSASFMITAILGGIMAVIGVGAEKAGCKTFWNIGFILSEMRSGRPAYLKKEELDVKSPKSVGLPHGAVIAVGTLFFLAFSAHFR